MNIDIMRSILMKIDAIETGIVDPNIDLTEFTPSELEVYCSALEKEGFLEISCKTPNPHEVLANNRLTTDGRNFIRVARNQVLWRNAKKTIKLSKREFPGENQSTDIHEMKFHFISMSN